MADLVFGVAKRSETGRAKKGGRVVVFRVSLERLQGKFYQGCGLDRCER